MQHSDQYDTLLTFTPFMEKAYKGIACSLIHLCNKICSNQIILYQYLKKTDINNNVPS